MLGQGLGLDRRVCQDRGYIRTGGFVRTGVRTGGFVRTGVRLGRVDRIRSGRQVRTDG